MEAFPYATTDLQWLVLMGMVTTVGVITEGEFFNRCFEASDIVSGSQVVSS